MANRIPFSREQWFDASTNQAFAGAKMFTFSSGTNTPKTTWIDAEESVRHANPIVADSNGIFPEIYGNNEYKIIIRSNDEKTLILESDPISAGSNAVNSSD